MADAADAVPAVLGHGPVACEGIDERITRLVPTAPAAAARRRLALRRADRGDARPRRPPAPTPWSPTPGRWTTGSSPTWSSSWRCGGSARTAPGSPPGPPTRRGRPAGRTPRSRRSASAPTCAPSTRCSSSTGSTARRTATSVTAASTSASTSPSRRHPGRAAYRAFVEDAARLAASYGGSLSGEHGDGRARSELLPLMYDEPALALFAEVKRLLDPAQPAQPRRARRPGAARRRRPAGRDAGRPGRGRR